MKREPTLLIVDDTPENLMILGELLQPHYRVRVANSGPRALKVATSEPKPDLILLDVMMSGMDGFELLRRLREHPDTREIPVIFVTGLDSEGDEERGLELGAVDYITKPIKPAVVLARVRTHLDLKRSRDLLKYENALVIETAQDWIFLKDHDLRYTIVNPAMHRDVAEAMSGRHDSEIFLNDTTSARMDAVDRRVLNGEVVRDELDIPLSKGISTFSITKVPMRDEDGNVVGLCGIGRDVTEQRLLGAQLIQAQKMESVGRLAGGIAHDFNNLLQAMMSQLTVARRRIEDKNVAERCLEVLNSLVRRGAGLTNQLLLFARRGTPVRESLDLNAIADEAAAMLRSVIRENVELRVERADHPAIVDADGSQMNQVLMNLIINALDALPQGGLIVVSVGGDSDLAVLSVRDTGHGIPDEVRAQLFEPFFTTKPVGKGTGLGLSVVHEIVVAHGGRIAVASSPGEGATFEIILPRTARRSADIQPEKACDLISGLGDRVLVVEDDHGVRDGLVPLLELMDFQVTAFATGEEALAQAGTMEYDFLVTDLTLPGIAGDKLAAILSARRPSLAIVFMSGYIADDGGGEPLPDGQFVYLHKPFDVLALSGALQQARAKCAVPSEA